MIIKKAIYEHYPTPSHPPTPPHMTSQERIPLLSSSSFSSSHSLESPPFSIFKECPLRWVRYTVASLSILFVIGVLVVLILLSKNEPHWGSVSSSNHYATEVGNEILKSGGNAIDAFVAMQAMLTLTEPGSSGFGGGLFLMIYNASENQVYAIDAREEAPENSNQKSLLLGGESVGTPGTVAAIDLVRKWCTKELQTLWSPTIEKARQGILIDNYTAVQLARWENTLKFFNSTRDLFFRGDSPLVSGSVFKNEHFAGTLEHLIDKGLKEFYEGELAQEIVNAINNDTFAPGNMTMNDLQSYKAVFRKPVWTTYKGYRLAGMGPPSSGAITIGLALNILENFENYKIDGYSEAHIQRMMDSLSLAFADRNAYIADADWETVPVEGLLDKEYAKNRSTLINMITAIIKARPGSPEGAPLLQESSDSREGLGGTSFSIIDQQGNVVVCTSTIGGMWGSFIVLPGRGFFLNNELADFNRKGVNVIQGGKKRNRITALTPYNNTLGGKRPRSSMSPTIVFQGDVPIWGLGSPNGSMIISAVYQVLLNLIDLKMDINKAVEQPRGHADNTQLWVLEPPLYYDTNLRQYMNTIRMNATSSLIGVVSVAEKSVTEWYRCRAVADNERRPGGLALFQQ